MREMKNSGIDWIGNVPTSWSIKRVKQAFFRKDKKAEQENPVVLSLARSGVKVRDISNNEGQLAESYFNYNPVEPGDLLLNPMDLYSGANCSISKVSGVISPAYFNLRAKSGVNPLFYDYYFKTQYWGMAMFAHGKGVSFDNRWTINNDAMMNYYIPFPSFEEQTRIANFLDKKVAAIDNVVAKTRESIEEYKKLKQSIITDAVTKGLNSDVEMKDSGVEWIGEIPNNWKILPLKSVLYERQEKNTPIKTKERLSLSIDLGVTLYAEKTTNLDRFKDDFEQYKLAYPGDLVLNSMNMIVGATGVSNYFGCVSPAYYTFFDKTEEHITTRYYEHLFKTQKAKDLFHSYGKGIYAIERGDGKVNTCRLKVAREDLKSFLVPVPPIDEQRQIVDFISSVNCKYDKILNSKMKFANELEQYKKSLIYEYVTGKKEVPND